MQLLIRERHAPKKVLKARIAVQRVEVIDLQICYRATALVIAFFQFFNSLVEFSQLREYNGAVP